MRQLKVTITENMGKVYTKTVLSLDLQEAYKFIVMSLKEQFNWVRDYGESYITCISPFYFMKIYSTIIEFVGNWEHSNYQHLMHLCTTHMHFYTLKQGRFLYLYM